jgi:signal transduction histidine kinase
MIKKISLRMRLTLITSAILMVFCIMVTLFTLYNANSNFVFPDVVNENNVQGSTGVEAPILDENVIYAEVALVRYHAFSTSSYIFMIISILLGSLLMYVSSGVALKQVRLLTRKIANIDKNELSFRITDFSAGDELNKLADSFNMMLTRLDIAFARESRFSADAAHELKTPLTVIKTNLDVLYLDENPTKEDCLESLEVVKKQTNRMIALVDDLFAMSTASVCNIENYVDVDAMLEEIAAEYEPKISVMHIRFKMDVKPCSVKANYVMLKHAISNILDNAIKYNYQDGEIEIRAYPEENNCAIYISDTGIGISEEYVKYIFEPFYRVDKSRSRAIGGAGLGLAIAYDIILKHQGTIEYSAAEQKGSIFKIVLPIE